MPKSTGNNPAPGFAERPDYRIRLSPAGRGLRVVAGCVIVADSDGVLVMRETGYPPVYYFPRADVDMDLLARDAHRTTCPFKGEATYWTLPSVDAQTEPVAWSYETPYDEMRAIAGMIAFYQDRVQLDVVG